MTDRFNEPEEDSEEENNNERIPDRPLEFGECKKPIAVTPVSKILENQTLCHLQKLLRMLFRFLDQSFRDEKVDFDFPILLEIWQNRSFERTFS